MAACTPSKFSGKLSRSIEDYPEGIILCIDKPYRWTSADVIRKLKYAACRHFGNRKLKIGHAGTLDPLATGVLLVCLGKATKMAEDLQAHDKEYIAEICFGASTPSYDREKEIDSFYPLDGVTRESVEAVLEGFKGEQEQIAPLFSAKSVDGVRAYELARKLYLNGKNLDSAAEELLRRSRIRIEELELLDFRLSPLPAAELPDMTGASGRINVNDAAMLKGLPCASIRLRCSKGTYIRAFARDLGERLGSGAFLSRLRRTASGMFRVEEALDMESALSLFENGVAGGSGKEI